MKIPGLKPSRNSRYGGALGAALLLLGLSPPGAAQTGGICSQTADLSFRACGAEARDDFFVGRAVCINESDPVDRRECLEETSVAMEEQTAECEAQRDARLEVCAAVGEGPYDPEFETVDFVSNYSLPFTRNPYLPLAIGNTWQYSSPDETVNIEVLNRTKLIDDVPCIVVRDTVREDGRLVEDTNDWFAQQLDGGDVFYCGEEVKDYETFAGDRPRVAELVSIDGSFKVDRDGAKPGIVVKGTPVPGQTYRQEYDIGNAEDVVEVLSVTYRYGDNAALDRFVPQALAEFLCSAGDCLVTRDFTPLSPGGIERKYYARGIGLFAETKPSGGDVLRLDGCNFDPRCANLP